MSFSGFLDSSTTSLPEKLFLIISKPFRSTTPEKICGFRCTPPPATPPPLRGWDVGRVAVNMAVLPTVSTGRIILISFTPFSMVRTVSTPCQHLESRKAQLESQHLESRKAQLENYSSRLCSLCELPSHSSETGLASITAASSFNLGIV